MLVYNTLEGLEEMISTSFKAKGSLCFPIKVDNLDAVSMKNSPLNTLSKSFFRTSGSASDSSKNPTLPSERYLAIYFPQDESTYKIDIMYNRVTINFPDYTYWGDFLEFTLKNPIPESGKQGYPGLYSTTNPLGYYSYRIVVKQQEQEYDQKIAQ